MNGLSHEKPVKAMSGRQDWNSGPLDFRACAREPLGE